MEEFRTGHAFIDMGEYNLKMEQLQDRQQKAHEREKAVAEGKIEVITYFPTGRTHIPDIRYKGKTEVVADLSDQLMNVGRELIDLRRDYERAKRRTTMMMDAIAKIVPGRFISRVNKELESRGYDDE